MIIRSATKLLERYSQLGPGDVFIGKIPFGKLKHTLLIDLLERGVHCLPSPLAQTLNGSKTAQAMLLAEWMVPLTCVIRRRADLFNSMEAYNRENVGSVITKEDRMHCGHGIRRWENAEALYNIVAFNKESYPFVLQPYHHGFTDLRIIMVGDYVEGYIRQNKANFRMNLAVGGKSRPHTPTNGQLNISRDVIRRSRFPYAHLDLMVFEDGRCYVSEIALNGGTKGARIQRKALDDLKKQLLEETAQVIIKGE
jgi:ribosomal protein S6--L-glutamate ligase